MTNPDPIDILADWIQHEDVSTDRDMAREDARKVAAALDDAGFWIVGAGTEIGKENFAGRKKVYIVIPGGPMTYVDKIVEKFGGVAALRRALDFKHESTIVYWIKIGSIPSKHHELIIQKGFEMEIGLTSNDFLPVNPHDSRFTNG